MSVRRSIKITVEKDVERWLLVKAAQKDVSVSQLVGGLLRRQMLDEDAYEQAREEHMSQKPVAFRRRGSYPSRGRMHDR